MGDDKNNIDSCSEYASDGFGCVLKEACLTDDLTAHRNYGADYDYDMDYDYDFDALIRESAEQSTCPDKEMVCCHELNKKEVPDEEKSYDYEINLKCYEFRKEGYRCVQDDQCGGLVDIRGLDDP